ncbi:MAG: apolipoprotein N-acyltransferase [Propionibacteriaceae bacterium]|nr:apolipoprotein N-acyltransferase [Propionibacteriaceae bacterium]
MSTRSYRGWLISGVALVAGLLVGAGFPPLNLWFLVPVGLTGFVLVSLASTTRIGLLRGFIFGFGFNILAFQWIGILGVGVLVLFMAWLAVWYAVVGLVISATRETPAWGFAGVTAWMGAEWACSRWPAGGFGWGRLAYTAVGTPIDGLFPFIGSTGVSLIIISTAVLIAFVVRPMMTSESSLRRLHPVPAAVLGGVLLVTGGAGVMGRNYDPPVDGSEITVAVVQGNVPGVGITALGEMYTVENNHLSETILLAAKIRTGVVDQPDFVAWPENSTATDPFIHQKTTDIIGIALDLVQVPILVGAITLGPGENERQTTGLWWTVDEEVTARYAKRNLVPFGEWIPLRSILEPLIEDLKYVGPESIPGTGPGVLNVEVSQGSLRVGDIICFELAYDSTFDQMILGDDTTGGGGQVLVVQTSNAMFTGTHQMAHQDHITRVRAMESRREILVATTNSLAGLVDSHGRIVYAAQMRTADSAVFTVPQRTFITPAVAFRPWIDLGSIVLPLLAGLGLILLRSRRKNEAG